MRDGIVARSVISPPFDEYKVYSGPGEITDLATILSHTLVTTVMTVLSTGIDSSHASEA